MILLCVYAATFLSKAVMTIFFDHYFEESLSSSTDMVYTCNKIPINFSGSHYVCARYDPGGNMMGDYPDNVFPPKPKVKEQPKENKPQVVQKPVQPARSVQPAQSVQPARSVQLARPVQPARSVQPVRSVQPAQPVQPVRTVQPVQSTLGMISNK